MTELMSIQEFVAASAPTREIVPPPTLSTNIFSEDESDIPAELMDLKAGDFQKWLRKIIRKNGRNSEICDQRHTPIEIWLKELGYDVCFLSSGEIEWQKGNDRINLFSGWASLCIEIYREEDDMMRTKAGEMLDVAMWENPKEFLIAR